MTLSHLHHHFRILLPLLVVAVAATLFVGLDWQPDNAVAAYLGKAPDRSSNLQTIPGSGSVTLSWSPPTNVGSAAITDYLIYTRTIGQWFLVEDGTNINTSYKVTGLTDGSVYHFRIAAINFWGTGAWAYASATPGIPESPTDLKTTPGEIQVSLSWKKPSDTGGSAISDYVIQYRKGNNAFTTFDDGTSITTTTTVTGLEACTSYDFRVATRNQANQSAWSESTPGRPIAVVPDTPTTPDVPSNVSSWTAYHEVGLAWGSPCSNGGKAITGYKVYYCSDNSLTGVGCSTHFVKGSSFVLRNIPLDRYDMRVAAVNEIGTGPWSSFHSLVPNIV